MRWYLPETAIQEWAPTFVKNGVISHIMAQNKWVTRAITPISRVITLYLQLVGAHLVERHLTHLMVELWGGTNSDRSLKSPQFTRGNGVQFSFRSSYILPQLG